MYTMEPMTKDASQNNGNITLHDIVAHIQSVKSDMRGMEKRLSRRIDVLEEKTDQRFASTERRLDTIDRKFEEIDERFNAVDEDLRAIGKDVRAIKLHTGMPVAAD